MKAVPSRPNLSVAFSAERAPFGVRVRGPSATISTVVTYRAKGKYTARFAPDVSASCGMRTDSAPRLRVALTTSVRLDPDWSLHPRTRVAAEAGASPRTGPVTGQSIFPRGVDAGVYTAARASCREARRAA